MNESLENRKVSIRRETGETKIELELDLDGNGTVEVHSGLGFLDHMLTALAFHAGWDFKLTAQGDLHVDDHHLVEDCGLLLGSALDLALGDKQGIQRFGSAYVPLDESLSRAVVDFSGRPWAEIDLALVREKLGDVACENLPHFFQSMAIAGKFCLHVDVIRGQNDHHRAESAFKAVARALAEACRNKPGGGIPSTKGVL